LGNQEGNPEINYYTQTDSQLLYFYEVNNRTTFSFTSGLHSTYENFESPQSTDSGITFDKVDINTYGSGLYHWKVQSIGWSFCGYLLSQDVGIVDVNSLMYPFRALIIAITTLMLGVSLLHVYIMNYSERPAVRQKISGPHCLDADHIPIKSLEDKENEIALRQKIQTTRGDMFEYDEESNKGGGSHD
jgi:hypothetical protein